MASIRESFLPGIGQKYEVHMRTGDKLVVVIHDDGRRELYHFSHENPDHSISMITLDDLEARQVAAIIGGMAYRPGKVAPAEVNFDDLVIEWFKVEPGSRLAGRSIGELGVRRNTGATIVAVVGQAHEKVVNPGPEHVIQAGSLLVVTGEREHIAAFKRLSSPDGA